ncbi:MAG: acyl-CoA thioesterase [Phycisphaerales bacterium]|nr:acyl-CoA thioesterase [Phycisphaerales bacterium]
MSQGEHCLDLRVRYCECDPMGVAHHSAHAVWFEMGRTELLRACGGNYRSLEAEGIFLVVVKLEVSYKQPVRYDDQLQLITRLVRPGPVKIEHTYELKRDGEVLATGRTLLACLGSDGRPRAAPSLC